MGPQCVWLFVIGGRVKWEDANVTDPNITMLIELGKQVITHTPCVQRIMKIGVHDFNPFIHL